MKNLKTFLTGAALVLITGTAMAIGNLKVNVISAGSDKAMVQISNATESKYEIELRNEKNDVVYYKQTESLSTKFNKQYNFAFLNDGNYLLTVKTNDEKLENTLEMNNGQIKTTNQRRVVEPYFTVNENLLELSYLNFELENIKVLLFDDNTLIYKKQLKPEFSVHYALDLSNLERGNYSAVLESGASYFEYNITWR